MGTTTDKLNKLIQTKAEIKSAIEKKGVTNVGDVFAEYPKKIAEIKSGGEVVKYTGHVDEKGLKAIGWTNEDIDYYQKYGVNWNEEDDKYHLVPEHNIKLYGVINANNIQDYSEQIVYLPKIDTSSVTDMSYMFDNCPSLTTIPLLDTSSVTNMRVMFRNCPSLTTIPLLDTSSVTNMDSMFDSCYSLTTIPLLDTSSVTDMYWMFNSCYSLITISPLDTSSVTDMSYMFNWCSLLTTIPPLDTSSVTDMSYMFDNCPSLTTIPLLDTSSVTDMSSMLDYCSLLYDCKIQNLGTNIDLSYSFSITKESIIYMINHAQNKPITITLLQYYYDKYSNDIDIKNALSTKPNIKLASV